MGVGSVVVGLLALAGCGSPESNGRATAGDTTSADSSAGAPTTTTTADDETAGQPSSSGAASSDGGTSATGATSLNDASSGGGDEGSTSAESSTGRAVDYDVLLDMPGEVFTPSPGQPELQINEVGSPGTSYRRLEVGLDVHVGQFRVDVPPDGIERWDHILFALYRSGQPSGWQRYLSGASARVEAMGPERLFNYARVEIGMGAPSYVSFKDNYPWAENTDIHLEQWIDAELDEQGLELSVDGAVMLSIPGPVPYFEPELTTEGLYLLLGGEDADWGLHVSPYGWTVSNVQIRGWPQ